MRGGRQHTAQADWARLAALPAGGLAQSAGSIPNQPWYPAGYLDMREAAASQVEDLPRNPRVVLMEDWDDPNLKTYDVIDCMLAYDLPEMAPYEREVGSLALDIARMRHELAEFGYAKEVYDGPLLDYERAALAAFDAERSDRAENPEDYRIVGDDGEDYGELVEMQNWDMLGELAEAMEARRVRLNPRLHRIVSEGGCGAGESEFALRLVPANGELWLINAFAFRVCERKVANPWDHRACGWTQYQEGDTTFASGRYMYEARWGSTVKRGTRELQGDPADEDVTSITFRRD